MYLNILKRQWCSDSLIRYLKRLPIGFSFYVLNVQHDKIYSPTFHERCVTHIVLCCGNSYESFEINGKMNGHDVFDCLNVFSEFIETYGYKTQQPSNLNKIQSYITTDVQTTLGIDNNVNQDKKDKITFCLNDYTPTERESIINFLANVDGNAPEVYIDVDLSKCSIEQAQYLSNLLICSSISSNSVDAD